MEFKKRTLKQIADMICGNFKAEESFFQYRSSSYLTEFFEDCGTEYKHDGSTRNYWVAEVLQKILAEPQLKAATPPYIFLTVIRTLMAQEDARNEASGESRRASRSEFPARARGLRGFLRSR